MDNYGGGPTRSGVVYQGYPYVNPAVLDVPTISAEDAAKWTNLPRKPTAAVKSGSDQAGGSSQGQSSRRVEEPDGSLTPKLDPDENPVVYIELPESNGSDVAERRTVEDDQTYVQDTIFYDPFKDRRIVTPGSSSGSSSISSSGGDHIRLHMRPNPPNTLNLGSPDRGLPSTSSTPGLPPSMSKQTDVYGQFGLPTEYQRGEFPEPPPAYTEIDTSVGSPAPQSLTPASPTPQDPPTPAVQTPPELARTQVIISHEMDPKSRVLVCCKCGVEGPCIPKNEVGFITHVVACFMFFSGLFPLIILVYCTSFFKYKNYYCNYCQELVAYEIPFACQELTYVTI